MKYGSPLRSHVVFTPADKSFKGTRYALQKSDRALRSFHAKNMSSELKIRICSYTIKFTDTYPVRTAGMLFLHYVMAILLIFMVNAVQLAECKMKHSLATEITIDAPPSAVWRVLTDFGSYAEWNPFIVSISGSVKVGEKLQARITPPGGTAMNFSPVVKIADEDKVLEWLGSVLVPFVFDGRHRFELTETAEGGTNVKHGEKFSGLLIPFFKKDLETKTKQGFLDMNVALKKRVEDAVVASK